MHGAVGLQRPLLLRAYTDLPSSRRSPWGLTPLFVSARACLALPASPRAAFPLYDLSQHRKTVLMYAAKGGNVAAIEALVAMGNDLNAVDCRRGWCWRNYCCAPLFAALMCQLRGRSIRYLRNELCRRGASYQALMRTHFTAALASVSSGIVLV